MIKKLKINILILVSLFKGIDGFSQTSFHKEDCYVQLEENRLILGNRRITREYLLNDGNLVSISLKNPKTGTLFTFDQAQPDFYLPEPENHSDSLHPVTWEWIVNAKSGTGHLDVHVITSMGNLLLKRIFSVYPDCPAIRCQLYLQGELSGNQTLQLKKKRVESAYSERVAPEGPHWKILCVELLDETDNNNNLVLKTESLPFTRQMKHRGNILMAKNLLADEGFFILKEGPAPPAQVNYPGFDFLSSITGNHFLDLRMSGIGVENEDINEDEWTRIYGFVTGISSGDWQNFSRDLRIYQKQLRKGYENEDEMIMMNTWGDRGQDSKINEYFIIRELAEAGRLGITHYQIDDGWQTGRSKNSAFEGGSLDNIWEKDNYWKVDPTKFPDGLESVCRVADSLNIHLGLWFNPSTDNEYQNWERDAEVILNLYRKYKIRYYKIDGVIIPGKKAEKNFESLIRRVHEQSNGEIIINLDVTGVAPRPGFLYLNEFGNIFLANRYTDWGNYYPHWTLRNIWQLSSYVPPEKIQLEFLNPWRNPDKYQSGDPLAPQNIGFDYQFAVTMMAQPLAWFEASGLPEHGFAIAPLVEKYKTHMRDIHAGVILPIGDAPDGCSWTGFQSTGNNEGYLLVYRENSDEDQQTIATLLPTGEEIILESIAGSIGVLGRDPENESSIRFISPEPYSFGLFRYTLRSR